MADVPSFNLRTPLDLFGKLIAEHDDLERSHWLDARHAINALWTAYHMYEWVLPEAQTRGLLTRGV